MPKYAIIDVETTGGQARLERITEIAIVLHDGERVLDTFTSLINPERSIPWNITMLTGITDDMVAHAPKFFEIARRVVEMTEGAVFVAHNAAFDYSFVREEFARLGYTYSRRQLCTVRLARQVFPGLPSYSLGNLKNHFGIHAERSHRALDDTLATAQIFERILMTQNGVGELTRLVNRGVRETKLPPNITLERLHELPEACGVYYLHDARGDVIYVGKSLNIRKRMFEHFADLSSKGEKLRTGVEDISFEITGSELIALLLESAEIKRLQPRVNRAQRTRQFAGAIFAYTDEQGYRRFVPGKNNAKLAKQFERIAEYAKLEHASAHLQGIVRQFELCHKLCHLDFHEHACFHYNIKQCRGACIGAEATEEYNSRAEAALAQLYRGLSGSFLLLEDGRTPDEQVVVAVLDGMYQGYAFIDKDLAPHAPSEFLEMIEKTTHDPDAGRIIRQYMTGKRTRRIALEGSSLRSE